LVNLSASHDFVKNKFMVYGSVNNLLDENFMGVYGFTAQRRNFLVGVKYNF
jgi:vitamin B12 transporter